MITAKVSAVKLCGVAAVVMALLCVAAAEAKAQPNNLMPGAKPIVIYPGIGRYIYHEELLTWAEAHATCLFENGHLAVINSDEEAEKILGIMSDYRQFDIHIGLHDSFGEGKFESVRGQALETLGYHTWSAGHGGGSGLLESYCALRNVGIGADHTGFYDISFNAQFPFICELPMWDDYDLVPGHGYYKLHNEWRTWKESLETCRSEGAHLLILTSTCERDVVVAKYSSVASKSWIWYGAHHMFTHQLFVTIFDELLEKSGFNSWDNGFPGDYPHNTYPNLGLNMGPGATGGLQVMYFKSNLPFICKHDLHDLA